MTLSPDGRSRLRAGLGSIVAADEMEGLLGGFGGAKVFYVHSGSGNNEYDGLSWSTPLATLAAAMDKVTASVGDVIVLRPGHAETTTAVALDVAGVRVVGLGAGRNKPAFTATTASSDLFSVSAANVGLYNVRLVGAASGCTALLNINAADFTAEKVVFEHGAAPLLAVTVVAAAHRFQLVDCQWRGTAAGPDVSVDIEGKVDDWAIVRPRADYGGSSGLDIAFLRSSFKMKGYRIEDPIVVSFDALVVDINSSSAAVGDGLMTNARCVGSGALTIANVNDVGGMAAINCQYTDSVAADGTAIPAATAD